MFREITNNQLWVVEDEISKINGNSPGLAFLLAARIDFFYKRNKMVLQLLHRRMHDIQKKYIVHDENGKPVYAETGEGEKKAWKYLESIATSKAQLVTGQDVAKAYQAEADEFLNRWVKIEL